MIAGTNGELNYEIKQHYYQDTENIEENFGEKIQNTNYDQKNNLVFNA